MIGLKGSVWQLYAELDKVHSMAIVAWNGGVSH